jgi:hypothetical protein
LVSVQNTHYTALPSQDRTDATVSVGGRLDVGEDKLTLAAAHIALHENHAQLDTIASDKPIAFQLDDARASYALTAGRWSIEPSIQATNWSYDATTILGVPASQAYRDRIVVRGGVTVRYEFAPLRSAMFVARAIGQDYLHTPTGQRTPNSTAYQFLAGIDYDDDQVWRWRLLVGAETREFASPAFPRQTNFIAEAALGWSPSGMTTVNAILSRETGDAAQTSVSGIVYTSARLTIDHEYLRNLLLRASFGWQQADFFQGGHQSGTTAALAVTWVMNRSARLSFTYEQVDLRSPTTPVETLAGGYSSGIGLITMRLGL